MDGYHKPLAELGPNEIKRRGAHWTFDGVLFATKVSQLAATTGDVPPLVLFNGWDHALKDPVKDAVKVTSDVKVVLLEGMHLFLDLEPWCSLRDYYDLKIWIEADLKICMERLIQRHLLAGLSNDEDEARLRVKSNDVLNAEFLLANSKLKVDFNLKN